MLCCCARHGSAVKKERSWNERPVAGPRHGKATVKPRGGIAGHRAARLARFDNIEQDPCALSDRAKYRVELRKEYSLI